MVALPSISIRSHLRRIPYRRASSRALLGDLVSQSRQLCGQSGQLGGVRQSAGIHGCHLSGVGVNQLGLTGLCSEEGRFELTDVSPFRGQLLLHLLDFARGCAGGILQLFDARLQFLLCEHRGTQLSLALETQGALLVEFGDEPTEGGVEQRRGDEGWHRGGGGGGGRGR